MCCGAIPRDVRKLTQNWCVDQMLRTRGIPTRSCARVLGAAEGGGTNHFRHVWISTFALIDPSFHDPHFVDVLQQPLRTGIAADDAFPAFRDRNFAPRPSRRPGQLHVDEGALAVAAAPMSDRMIIGRGPVSEGFNGGKAAKSAAAARGIGCA